MSYTSNLKDWGATGLEYPNGYLYVQGEPPVDEYDNFIWSNLSLQGNNISDVRSSGDTVVVSGTQYEIQKNGTDGTGVINFKK